MQLQLAKQQLEESYKLLEDYGIPIPGRTTQGICYVAFLVVISLLILPSRFASKYRP